MDEYLYPASHLSSQAAVDYEALYAPGTFDAWLWEREKTAIDQVLAEHFPDLSRVRYLDFACGTGRLAAFLEDRVAESTGIDVSEAMLSHARRRLRRTRLLVGDIRVPSVVPGPFDLITAFRFFLNCDPGLRMPILAALRARLSPEGLLLVNLHGNAWSMRAPSVLVRRYLLRQGGVNQMGPVAFLRMLRSAGFEVVGLVGVGAVTQRLYKVIGRSCADHVSGALEGLPFGAYFCVDLVGAARPRSTC